MPYATSDYTLGQEFNKFYLDVVNCEIEAPPYHSGRVPYTFFLKKRGGMVTDLDLGNTVSEILDEYTYTSTDKYYLVREATKVHVYHNDTQITTGMDIPYTAGVNYKFLNIDGAHGTVLESGSSITGAVVGTDLILTDATKTWTAGEFAGAYIHLIAGTAGGGQVLDIADTTVPDKLKVSGWAIQPDAVSYKIYDKYGATLSFIGGDGIYMIHNDTSIDKIEGTTFTGLIDAIYSNGQIYFIGTDKGIYIGDKGKYNGVFLATTRYIGFTPDGVNIIEYQQFVLILGTNSISTVLSSQTVLPDGSTATLYRQLPVSNTSAILRQNAFVIFNQGLYVVTQNRRFVALSITTVGLDKFMVDEQDQGIYIQRFLDAMLDTDHIRVEISDRNIAIIHRSGSVSTIHIFDIFYKGWYRWTTNLPITRVIRNRLMGDKIYALDATENKDEGDQAFIQYVRIIVGEDKIKMVKRSQFFKILIGSKTTQDSRLTFGVHVGGSYTRLARKIGNIKYLVTIDALGGVDPVFNNIIWGTSLLSQEFDASTAISNINVIELPTGFFYELGILEFEGIGEESIELGGVFTGYDELDPHVTPFENVV